MHKAGRLMYTVAMHLAIDARLQAYRAGGISEHIACLIDGLAELAPPERILVLTHRRARLAGTHVPTGPNLEFARLFTPPHNRFEGLTLPLELMFKRLSLLHSPDTVSPRFWHRASVVTVHDLAFVRYPEFLTADSARYYRGVYGAVQRAHRVIAVSDYTRRELETLTAVRSERIRVIPNSVHPRYRGNESNGTDDKGGPAATLPDVLARYGLTAPYILFVSTIEPRKNIGTLLEAYRLLMERGCTLPLVLVGGDGWKSEPVYRQVEQLGLNGRAHFLGYVPHVDLAALYRGAAVLAHPALDEGFGLTPLEAMASGTPAVVADAGSLPEVTADAALHVAPHDVRAWAAALERVLTDKSLARQLSEAGRARSGAYTVARMAGATLDVYREARAEWMAERVRSAM